MTIETEKARDARTDELVDAIIDRTGSQPPHAIRPRELGLKLLKELAPVEREDSDLFNHIMAGGLAALVVERCSHSRLHSTHA